MTEPMQSPRVGTGVYIRKDGKVLMGMRMGKNGKGMWCAPGGKLEMNEDPVDNVIRETREESGLEIARVRFVAFTNDPSPQVGTHFVTLHFVADWVSGEPQDEIGAMEKWQWVAWDDLPEPLFWCTRNFLKTGYNPLNF